MAYQRYGKTEEQRRMDFINGLRQLAEMYEKNPELPIPTYTTAATVWIHRENNTEEEKDKVKNKLKTFVKALGGCDKDIDDSYFRMIWHFGPIQLRVISYRENVCERVVVGTRTIPAEEAKFIPAQEVRVENIYEYNCPSILK